RFRDRVPARAAQLPFPEAGCGSRRYRFAALVPSSYRLSLIAAGDDNWVTKVARELEQIDDFLHHWAVRDQPNGLAVGCTFAFGLNQQLDAGAVNIVYFG